MQVPSQTELDACELREREEEDLKKLKEVFERYGLTDTFRLLSRAIYDIVRNNPMVASPYMSWVAKELSSGKMFDFDAYIRVREKESKPVHSGSNILIAEVES